MNIHGISTVWTSANVVANKLQHDTLHPEAIQKAQNVVDISGSTTSDSKVNKAGQRVQPRKNVRNISAEHVDFRTGVVETFINEMDLIKKQMLKPAEEMDFPHSLDAQV